MNWALQVPSTLRTSLSLCALSWPLLPCVASQAQDALPTACEFERYVLLEAAEGFGPALADEVRKDLSAELGPRGFGVCAEPGAGGELAAEVVLSQPDPATISIDVDDHTTGKRVGRDLRLARIPAGGKALAIAIATDELLRASWAELILRRDEPEAEAEAASDAPRAGGVPDSARSSWRVTRSKVRFELGALLGYSYTGSAWDAGSLELRAEAWPLGWGWLSLGVGGVLPRTVDVALGEAAARGMLASLTLGACAGAGKLTGCAGARSALYLVQFRGRAARGADGLEDHASALVLSALVQLRLALTTRLSALLELGVGGAAASALATDGARSLLGIDGFVLSSGLGLGVSL